MTWPECIRQMFLNRKCYVCLKIIGFMYVAGIVNNFEVQSVFMTQSQKEPCFFIQKKLSYYLRFYCVMGVII